MKTHSSYKKVLNKRNSGTIGIACSGGRHNTGKKSSKVMRRKRSGKTLSSGDLKRIKSII